MLREFGLVETKAKTVKVGDLFGRLEVLAVGQIPFTYRYYSVCKCECGEIKKIRSDGLVSGGTLSCGCYHSDISTKHGEVKSGHFARWTGMMRRCYKEKDPAYKRYGGRGIKVCERWHDVSNYVNDINVGYFENADLDRIDNDGDYSPKNTRWATRSENCRNRSSSIMITHEGETLCAVEWAEKIGGNDSLILNRIKNGWSIKDALTIKPDDETEKRLRKERNGMIKYKPPKRKPNTVEYNGKTYTYKELSYFCGVSTKLLNKRIRERGWSVEEAVKNQSFKGRNVKL